MPIQTILDGPRNVVVKVVNEAGPATTIVDVSALVPACTQVTIDKVWYSKADTATLQVLWDATADVVALDLAGRDGFMDFTCFGGLVNNAGAGITGDIQVTGPAAYTLILYMSKRGVIDRS